MKLADGLRALATAHGVTFREPLQIDARGEFALIVERTGYGEKLAALLSRHNARTGIRPGAMLDALNGWCAMNHFDVERMLSGSNMPETGEEIVPLTVADGVLTAGRVFKVNPRAGYKLAAHEFSGSDGSRHSVAWLYPCKVDSGPAFAPWNTPSRPRR